MSRIKLLQERAHTVGSRLKRGFNSRLSEKKASLRSISIKCSSAEARNFKSLLRLPVGYRVGTIDADLSLPRAAADNLRFLEARLQKTSLPYWSLNIKPWSLPQLNLLEDDFDSFLETLKNDAEFSSWYYKPILENGTTSPSTGLVQDLKQDSKVFCGIRLFRYIAPAANSSFCATEAQGIDLVRWEVRSDELVLLSRAWNSKCVELPNPAIDEDVFSATVALANSATGHHVDFPVDAVITWVDGNDSKWMDRKNEALASEGKALVQDATSVARFEPLDELRYCLRSIEQYAPWIRKIFLVTDQQVPHWLFVDENDKLTVIDHKDIWKDDGVLPVFNSHAIEANLHRIPGLSDHFLYFNDDMILTAPLSPDNFFHPSGVSKVFYSKALVDFSPVSTGDNVSTVASKNARSVLTSIGLPAMNRKFFHTPYPLRRSILEELELLFPELISQVSANKFRSMEDIALAGSFYFNYCLAKGQAVPGKIRYDYIDPADPAALRRLDRIIRTRRTQCVVINDGSQALNLQERELVKKAIPQRLSQLLPVKSSFER
ncbi:stealth conserved region 3 domain-containing protein [Glutamicibacter sp. BSL13]